jgi:hypothetical protein
MSSTSSSPPPPSKAKRRGCIHGARPQPLIVSSAPAEASRPSKKPRVSGGGGDTGPVIVYELTPRVVHVEQEEFMAVVQKLTGGKQQPAAASTLTTLPAADQVAGGDHAAAAAAAADPLVLTLGQQRQPAPAPAIDGDHPAAPPHSPPADAFLLSPSSFFLSPTTMHSLQELAALF